MDNKLEIITELPGEFLQEFEQEFQRSIPAEKVRATLNQAFIGRAMIAQGATAVEGLGQRKGEIDARTYFRWHQAHPGFWNDPKNVNEFFHDNPDLKDKGFNPKVNNARHGKTFIGGKPV